MALDRDTEALAAALEERAEEAAAVLKALANPHRLLILCLLAGGESSVAELEARLGLRQASVSQLLARLRHEGLVIGRREGRHIRYRLADPRIADILATLHRVFCPDLT